MFTTSPTLSELSVHSKTVMQYAIMESSIIVVTADHGNADCMWTVKKGVKSPMVAHTLNPVPFIVKDFSGANDFEQGFPTIAY